jgi:hypothetical protein
METLVAIPRIACADHSPDEIWVKARPELEQHGLVVAERIGEARFVDLMRRLGRVFKHPDADEGGLTHLAADSRRAAVASGRAFSQEVLPLHTDSSSTSVPPAYVGLLCVQPAPQGGHTLCADIEMVMQSLGDDGKDCVESLMDPECAVFMGRQGEYHGGVFEHSETGRLRVRYRADKLGYFNLQATRSLHALQRAIQACETRFSLGPEDAYIMDNYRWLHGRGGYTGERRMVRILIENPQIPAGIRPPALGDGAGQNDGAE